MVNWIQEGQIQVFDITMEVHHSHGEYITKKKEISDPEVSMKQVGN